MLKNFFKTKFLIMFHIGIFLIQKSYPLNKFGSYLINKVLTKNIKLNFGLEIIQLEHLTQSKCIILTLNNYLLLEANELLPSIFLIIQNEPKIKKFSEYKIIFCSAISEYKEFSLHNNFLIGPQTTILDYYNHYKNNLKYLIKTNYNPNNINLIKIKIWNMDHFKYKNIYLNKF